TPPVVWSLLAASGAVVAHAEVMPKLMGQCSSHAEHTLRVILYPHTHTRTHTHTHTQTNSHTPYNTHTHTDTHHRTHTPTPTHTHAHTHTHTRTCTTLLHHTTVS